MTHTITNWTGTKANLVAAVAVIGARVLGSFGPGTVESVRLGRGRVEVRYDNAISIKAGYLADDSFRTRLVWERVVALRPDCTLDNGNRCGGCSAIASTVAMLRDEGYGA